MTTSSSRRAEAALAYRFHRGLYLNLTNRCPTRCRFCAKRAWKFRYRGIPLALGRREPSAQAVWRALADQAAAGAFEEVVFCGFGEPTYRLPALLDLAARVRRQWPGARIRLNTIGLGNAINGRNIAPELARAVDAVRVSLNASDERQWRALHDPLPRFAKEGFRQALTFVADCVAAGIDTTITAVELPGVDHQGLRRLAEELGAGFLARPQLVTR